MRGGKRTYRSATDALYLSRDSQLSQRIAISLEVESGDGSVDGYVESIGVGEGLE
jgi:hypothetical protein